MIRKLTPYLYILLLCAICQVHAQYRVENLPNPKSKGQDYFVSDPDRMLNQYNIDELNAISLEIDTVTKVEYAIVIVRDYIGDSDFDFALDLFNTWGIGKKDANNGLLLFVAQNRREYRFISGYGIEAILPDALLKRIGEQCLVPNFRNNDYDKGLLEASRVLLQLLKSPDAVKELNEILPEEVSFWSMKNPIFYNSIVILAIAALLYFYVHIITKNALKGKKQKANLVAPIFYGMGCMVLLMFLTIFIFAFVLNNVEEVYQLKNLPYFVLVLTMLIISVKITSGTTKITKSYPDEQDLQHTLKKYVGYLAIPMLLLPLSWIDLIGVSRRLSKNKGRFTPPDESGNWKRINRSDHDARKYLDKGQRKEEDQKSLRYEIWKNKSGEVKHIAWDIRKTHSNCPKCHYRTLVANETRTIQSATYSSPGKGEKFDKCYHCNYLLSKGYFVIPEKERSSSSSSGGGSSSSGGSSGGGSFGGGSSGGGGAGGRW